MDISIPENRQHVEGRELAYRLRTGGLGPEEAYGRAEELLRLTYREGTGRTPFRKELNLINTMCISLWRMGRRQEAIAEYKRVWERFEQSRVRTGHHLPSVDLILDNLSLYLFHSGSIGEAEEWSVRNAGQQLLNGRISKIHYALSNLVGAEEDRAERQAGGAVDFKSPEADFLYGGAREKCLRYMGWAVDITDIFRQKLMRARLVEFGKRNLGADFKED